MFRLKRKDNSHIEQFVSEKSVSMSEIYLCLSYLYPTNSLIIDSFATDKSIT